MYTSPRIAWARAVDAAGSSCDSGNSRPRWMRMAALSVSTVPSGRRSVGICFSGLMRSSSPIAESGSHDDARTRRNGTPVRSSAASTAADPDPWLPYRLYMLRAPLASTDSCPLILPNLSSPRREQCGAPREAVGRPVLVGGVVLGHRRHAGRQHDPRLLRRGVDVDVGRQPVRLVERAHAY